MKRFLLILIICFISMYFLLAGIFGSSGYLYNESLKKQIKQKQMMSERLAIDIENLKNRQSNLSSEEGLRDSAIGLGLYVDGDTVYLYDTPALQENENSFQIDTDDNYEPLSVITIILLSLCISIVISFVIWYFSKDDNSDNEEMKQIQSGSDLFINA